jgi:hypothetical protein
MKTWSRLPKKCTALARHMVHACESRTWEVEGRGTGPWPPVANNQLFTLNIFFFFFFFPPTPMIYTEYLIIHISTTLVYSWFCVSTWHSWSYHRERSISWGNASMRFSCKAFSQLVIKMGGPIVGGAVPGLVVLGFYKKAGWASQGRQASKEHPSTALHQLLLPAMREFQSCILY